MVEEPISGVAEAAPADGAGEAMHIHRPKPLHGLREFAVEIGVIVIGVLIALFAEQTVERLDWAHKVQIANLAMTEEITKDDGPEIYQRAAMDGCLKGRLDAIEYGLETHVSRQEMLGLVRSYQVQYLSYDTLQREAANNSGVAVHFPEQQYGTWAKIYSEIPIMDRTAALEARDLGRLHALRADGGALSDGERDRLLDAAESLRSDENVMFQAASWILPQIFKAGLKLAPDRVAQFMGSARQRYQGCLSNIPMDWDGRALAPAKTS
jgi:hypothetical protein